jgi:TolB-like protein
MFTDIVGYTALMGENEASAYQLLKKNRQVQKPIIEKHGGKWLKEMGDGVLASFQTVSDSVYCAIEIQESCLEEPELKLRIGIHQGEVIMEDEDVFGDGVNIASRLEPLAPAGGIYVSESVFRNIQNKEGIRADFVREEILKNVKYPVKIYEVKVNENESLIIDPVKSEQDKNIQKPTNRKNLIIAAIVFIIIVVLSFAYFIIYKQDEGDASVFELENIDKSIAVLPFRNDSPNNENVYFCNGMMEGILDHLSKIPDLSVVSRTSVEQYRDDPPSVVEIAKKLGVNYILEGSVLRIGDQAKISAQLIYAPEDRHLWSKQFDKNVEDIFVVLSEVTQAIANDLKATISPDILERIASEPTSSITAYDYYLQGKDYLNNGELDKAESLYLLALDKDSSFALAFSSLANIYWWRNQFKFYKDDHSVDTVLQLCNKAITLDPTLADAYRIRGAFLDHIMFAIEKAERDFRKAIELNPNHLAARRGLAFLLAFHNRDYVSSLKMLRSAEKIDRSPGQLSNTYNVSSLIYRTIGNWEKSMYYYNMAKELNPLIWNPIGIYLEQNNVNAEIDFIKNHLPENSQGYLVKMGLCYIISRKYDQALNYYEKWEKKLMTEEPDNVASIIDWYRYGQALIGVGRVQEGIEMMKDQLKRNDDIVVNFQRKDDVLYSSAGICAFLGEKERAYEYLGRFDKSDIRWDSRVYLVQVDPLFDNIREDAEFKTITNQVLEEHKRIREEIAKMELAGEL